MFAGSSHARKNAICEVRGNHENLHLNLFGFAKATTRSYAARRPNEVM